MPLVRFNGSVMMSIGTIRLPMLVEVAIILMNLVVLNTPTYYNIIMDHSWIHKMRVVPLMYH